MLLLTKTDKERIFASTDIVLQMWKGVKAKLRANSLRIHEGWNVEFDNLAKMRTVGDAVGCTIQMDSIAKLLPLVMKDLNKAEMVGAKERGVKVQ